MTTYDVNIPTAGFYKIRLAKGAAWSPVRIWFGPPLDPYRPRLLDRSPRWQCLVNGLHREEDFWLGEKITVWPYCARWPICAAEYRYLLRLRRWARQHAPDEPAANPRRTIDFATINPAF